MTALASATPDFLDRFEAHVQHVLSDERQGHREPVVLLEAARHLTFAGAAKRMRPLLVDYFGAALKLEERHRLQIATAAEFIHTASLLHDDVIDEGHERRGAPTVNAQWHNSVAVLGGDLVLCLALQELTALPRQISIDAVALVAEMTRAAMLEVEARRHGKWTLADWQAIADGKTGALLAWCGVAPALATGQTLEARRFGSCGRHLGLAFQLTDDLLDLLARSDESGKDRLQDLKNKNPSFPVALARSLSDDLESALDDLWSKEIFSSEQMEDIAEQIVKLDVPRLTLARIEDHLDAALAALGDYRQRPGGKHIAGWADQLRQIARFTLESA